MSARALFQFTLPCRERLADLDKEILKLKVSIHAPV